MKTYDVIVIGAGPGGYVAAIRCAQLGLRTACIDRWMDSQGKPALGGTCLNVGCIPSKALLESSRHYYNLSHQLPAHGIRIEQAVIDVAAMQARKDKVVKILTTGIKGLFRKNQIEWLPGHARLLQGRQIEIAGHGESGKEVVGARYIIIATGSVPQEIPAAPVAVEGIVDSTGALEFQEVPERLGIIGAGVIGLELGSVWSRLGSEVVLLEALEDFLPVVDRQIAAEALKVFSRQGLDIRLGARVTSSQRAGNLVSIRYQDKEGEHTVEVNKLVVAVGRRACTSGLGIEEIGLPLDEQGKIQVDDRCQTSIEGIYAIGDVVRGPMLAHKASEEGMAVAEWIAGQSVEVDYRTIPWVIYTHPEIAWVGKNAAELDAEGVAYRTGTFPFRALGRAHGAGETEGIVKILGHARTDRILGVHIFGAHASELMAEAVALMQFSASTEDLARIVHAHPTLSEAMHEAALAVDGRAIHI